MREASERDDDEIQPEPGPRWIVQNREDVFASVDSLGLIWTSHAVSALAFTSEQGARKWIARSFHTREIVERGIVPLDVSAWTTRPARALGDGQ